MTLFYLHVEGTPRIQGTQGTQIGLIGGCQPLGFGWDPLQRTIDFDSWANECLEVFGDAVLTSGKRVVFKVRGGKRDRWTSEFGDRQVHPPLLRGSLLKCVSVWVTDEMMGLLMCPGIYAQKPFERGPPFRFPETPRSLGQGLGQMPISRGKTQLMDCSSLDQGYRHQLRKMHPSPLFCLGG